MPRFNHRGDVTPQLGYSWYDDTRFIYQDCSTGVCRIVLSDGTPIAEAGTNILIANGRKVWAYVDAATGHGDATQAVYHDSFGRTRTNSFPFAIGPDGAICVKPHSNFGATVIEANGTEWTLPAGDAQSVQLLGNRDAIWSEGGVVASTMLLVGNPGTPVQWPRATADHLLLYQDMIGRLVLGGHVIGPASPFYFYPDVIFRDGVYRVCWSPSQNDTNAQFLTLTPAQLAALPTVGAVIPKPTPPPPSPPPPKSEPPVSLPDPAAVKAALQVERDKFPQDRKLTEDEMGIILNNAAFKFQYMGMHRKDGQAKQPVTGIGISHDVLRYLPPGDDLGWWSDVLGASGVGKADPLAPEWKRSTDDARSFVLAVRTGPVPPPPLPPPPTPTGDLESRVRALEQWQVRVRA